MKTHSIFQQALFLVFLVLSLASEGLPNKDHKYETTCNTKLTRAYGMLGRHTPFAARMEMCPTIVYSCCQKRDQIMIFNNWVHMKEKEFVLRRYDRTLAVYTRFLDNLANVVELVEKVNKDKLLHKRISNCKELGKRISHFEIKNVLPQIRKNINATKNFLETSYKGFYCALCNHQNHFFINTENRSVTFSDSFCRSMMESSLAYLIFFHVDIVKLANMVSKYVTSCDFKGDYDGQAVIPKKMIFFSFEDVNNQLSDCRDNRNNKEWMSFCEPVCQNFKIGELDPFFEPNLNKIEKYNKWLPKQLFKIRSQHLSHPMFHDKPNIPEKDLNENPRNRPRMLFSRKKRNLKNCKPKHKKRVDKEDTAMGMGAKFVNDKHPGFLYLKKQKKRKDDEYLKNRDRIFISKMTSKVDVAGYTSLFAEVGVHLFQEGSNSNISEDMFNEVKTIIHLMNMKGKQVGIRGFFQWIFGLGDLNTSQKDHLQKSKMLSNGSSIWASRSTRILFLLAFLRLIW